MDYINLGKLYPVKIPVKQHAGYYLEMLSRSPEFNKLPEWIKDCVDFEASQGVDSKHKVMSNTVAHFLDMGVLEMLNEPKLMSGITESSRQNLPSKSLEIREGEVYLSLDIRQANWSVLNYTLRLGLPDWETYTSETLGMHPALVNSKSFRQAVLGNLNPKRQSVLQKEITLKHLDMLKQENVVSMNTEEIIITVKSPEKVDEVLKMDWILPVKGKLFTSSHIVNFGETVRVDTILNNDFSTKYKKLTAVNGNRFFMHFKTLILNDLIEPRDLLFINDRHLAKWEI
jgi:hypothetical protein